MIPSVTKLEVRCAIHQTRVWQNSKVGTGDPLRSRLWTSSSRTARCAPACRVVWQGRSLTAPPYADAYFRVFTRVSAGSCGLRRAPFLPPTGTFYSPFAYSLSDPPHPAQAEVRKARPSPLYKSMTYARTNQSVFLWFW